MNTLNAFVAGVVVLVLIFIGYMFWNGSWVIPSNTPPVTTTPPPTQTTTPPPVVVVPPTPAEVAGLPGVLTGSLAVPANVSAVITGYVAPNGAATTYWYDYGTTNSLSIRTTPKSAGGGFVTLATPTFLSGLTSNTTYFYRLSAQNSFGALQGATYSFTTTTNPPPTGSIPTVSTNAATDVARTTATLNGHVDPNNEQTTYWFDYGTTQNFGNVSAFVAAGSGTDSISVAIPVASLEAQTKYYYRINAQNNYGTISGPIQNFTTLGPAVTGLPTVSTSAATNVSTSSATFNGRVNPHNVASTYWFEYSRSQQFSDILGTVSATQTLPAEVTTNVFGGVTGLSNNTRYYYRLVVRNPQGTTVGDSASFTTRR